MMGGKNSAALRRRVPLQSVSFSDARGPIKGFASGWFFWVHQAFKEALDIRFVERIDPDKTAQLRERLSNELSRLSLAELRGRRNESLQFRHSYAEVMKRSRKTILETEAVEPFYTFRKNDQFESRCGEWQLRITDEHVEAIAGVGDATKITYAELGIVIYRRCTESGQRWKPDRSLTLQQPELVQLLKTGRAPRADLTASEKDMGDVGQSDLF